MIKPDTTHPGMHFSSILLTGTILLANADSEGMLAYGVKAIMGGAIWLGYKLAADYFDRKRRQKK